MAAKKTINWPLSTTNQAQTPLLAKKHKLAESAKINQFLAESTNFTNGFHWLLKGAQHLATAKAYNERQVLSLKTRSEKLPENHILAEAAILSR
jgi:hypothetical protein